MHRHMYAPLALASTTISHDSTSSHETMDHLLHLALTLNNRFLPQHALALSRGHLLLEYLELGMIC